MGCNYANRYCQKRQMRLLEYSPFIAWPKRKKKKYQFICLFFSLTGYFYSPFSFSEQRSKVNICAVYMYTYTHTQKLTGWWNNNLNIFTPLTCLRTHTKNALVSCIIMGRQKFHLKIIWIYYENNSYNSEILDLKYLGSDIVCACCCMRTHSILRQTKWYARGAGRDPRSTLVNSLRQEGFCSPACISLPYGASLSAKMCSFLKTKQQKSLSSLLTAE